MRTLPGMIVVVLSVTLAGCNLPSRMGRAPGGQAARNTPQPFTGLATGGTPAKDDSSGSKEPGDASSLASGGPRRTGFLAGQVLDGNSQLRPGAVIQVIDLESAREGAALSVKANREGYFDIGGLEVGRNYQLLARVKDGRKMLVGSVRVVAPNIRVAIYLDDEVPVKEGDSAGTASPRADAGPMPPPPPVDTRPSGPAATIGTPVRPPSDGVTTPVPGKEGENPGSASGPPAPAVNTNPDPSLLAEKEKGKRTLEGNTRELPPPAVTIPGRDHTPEKSSGVTIPVPPPGGMGEPAPAAPPVPAPASGNQPEDPVSQTVVPSCVRVGSRVENFALYDTAGKPYEMAKHFKGKVMLLDFWFADCGPCRAAIPKLNELQAKYGKYGLEVVGVAYEAGTLAEKQKALAEATRKYRLKTDYKVLFGGGGTGNCPLADQMQIHRYPTLVLLDQKGTILARYTGLDSYSKYNLEVLIYQTLFPRRLASNP